MKSNIRRNDLELYENYAEEWWDPESPRFKSLQHITPFRLELLESWIPELTSLRIIDLGCGGGLLAAPLSKRGARVTGIDRSPGSVAQAKKHSDPSAVFFAGDIRHVDLPDASAELVLLADVLDHIHDYELVLAETYRLLVPGGYAFVNTINRTFLAKLLAVTIGENIGLVPPGTHDPAMFIRPKELASHAEAVGFRVCKWQGERPAIRKTWNSWAVHFAPMKSLSVAYSALLQKP